MKKDSKNHSLEAFICCSGRCERIRTFDPLHPMQVRYQAAPHTEAFDYNERFRKTLGFPLQNLLNRLQFFTQPVG